MNLSDKPRGQWTDADLQADQFRKRILSVADRLRDAADRVLNEADRVDDLSTIRGAHPASRIAEEVIITAVGAAPGGVLGGLAVDAADVDARYLAERQTSDDMARAARVAEGGEW